MTDLKTVQYLVSKAIPYNAFLGIEVTSAEEYQAEVRLVTKPDYLNHVGTMHAGAQFSLGEAASGAILATVFSDLVAAGILTLATQAKIKYHKPAKGDLRAIGRLNAEDETRSREELEQKGRTRITVQVQVMDSFDTVVSELEVEWIFLKPK